MTTPPTDSKSRFERHPPGTKEKAFLLYSRHNTLAMISATLGPCLATIRKWSSSGRWKERRLLLEASKASVTLVPKPSDQEPEADEAFEQLKALPLGAQQTRYEQMMRETALRVALTMHRATDACLVSQADKWAKLDTTARKALGLETAKPECVINVGLLAGTQPWLMEIPPAPAPRLPAVEVPALAP